MVNPMGPSLPTVWFPGDLWPSSLPAPPLGGISPTPPIFFPPEPHIIIVSFISWVTGFLPLDPSVNFYKQPNTPDPKRETASLHLSRNPVCTVTRLLRIIPAAPPLHFLPLLTVFLASLNKEHLLLGVLMLGPGVCQGE